MTPEIEQIMRHLQSLGYRPKLIRRRELAVIEIVLPISWKDAATTTTTPKRTSPE